MTIHIEALTFDVIIGLLDFERDKPQRVIIDLKASYDYENDLFIDYTELIILMKEELKTKRYELLENALLGLKERLTTTYPELQTLSLKLSKPDIVPECTVSLSKSWNF